MADDRYGRYRPQGEFYGSEDPQAPSNYGGRDYARDGGYSSARDYRAAGEYDQTRRGYGARDYGERGGDRNHGQGDQYGSRDYGHQRYDQRDQMRDRDNYARSGQGDYYRDAGRQNRNDYRGSYAHDGHRWQESDRDTGGQDRRQGMQGGREDRGFMARAGDEVRSWFGDEDAERRREQDARYDERWAREHGHRDHDYHNWRQGQIAALDRDYDEYRTENRQRFENEFSSWRTTRQGQRDSLKSVKEHQEVVGSDGQHVGTVDKVRGDRIILTKNDKDAGGHHHSIPSRWIRTVDDKVMLSKTAAEAQQAWRDEENTAMFGGDRSNDRGAGRDDDRAGTNLNRSFSGTY